MCSCNRQTNISPFSIHWVDLNASYLQPGRRWQQMKFYWQVTHWSSSFSYRSQPQPNLSLYLVVQVATWKLDACAIFPNGNNVYICMCIHIYIYIYVCVCVCMYVYLHIFIYSYCICQPEKCGVFSVMIMIYSPGWPRALVSPAARPFFRNSRQMILGQGDHCQECDLGRHLWHLSKKNMKPSMSNEWSMGIWESCN